MKKVFVLFITLLLLTSCFGKDKKEKDEEVSDEEKIIYVNNYDSINAEVLKTYDEKVDPNDAWSISGDGSFESEVNKKIIRVSANSSVLLNSTSIMLKNNYYNVSFNIVSEDEVSTNLNISSSSATYLNEDIVVSSGTFSYDFSNAYTDYDVGISFNINNDSDKEISLEIDDFSISSSNRTIGTRINQVAYMTNLEKEVVFNYNPGNYFGVYDSDNNLVYVSDVSKAIYEKDSNETLYRGFFKDFNGSGTYYIKSEFGNYSYDFNVGDDVYDELLESAIHFLYLQRCGQEIDDEYLGHGICHDDLAKFWSYTKDINLDLSGGWHDAGDYGKYLVTTNKVIADLEFSYLYGDNKSDSLLSELKYGLDFVLKTQTDYGATYNKVVTQNFADFVSPEYDTNQVYALYPWTLTTASFAGVAGLAYKIYKDSDSEYANKCLEAHNKAIEYLMENDSSSNQRNPDEFNVGTYYDDNESDERLFAYSVAYKINKDNKYLDKIKELFNSGIDTGSKTANCRVYAYISLLDSLDMTSDFYVTVKDKLKDECNSLADGIGANVYAYPYSSYLWGSNQHVSDGINELLLGARYLKDERYLVRASESINYILGMNTLDMSFVYGFGYNYPSTIHSRLANSKGVRTIKGAMVNGVSQYLSEGIVGDYFDESSPIAKRFVDNKDSYSNVEPAINYNSALILSLSLLDFANNNELE